MCASGAGGAGGGEDGEDGGEDGDGGCEKRWKKSLSHTWVARYFP